MSHFLLSLLAITALASCGPQNYSDARTNTSHYWPNEEDNVRASHSSDGSDSMTGPGNH